MTSRESRPGSDYYEDPYIPSDEERRDWKTLPLRPVEAHYLLVNNVGRLNSTDALALRAIAYGDYLPDQEIDFLAIRRELAVDGGYGDD